METKFGTDKDYIVYSPESGKIVIHLQEKKSYDYLSTNHEVLPQIFKFLFEVKCIYQRFLSQKIKPLTPIGVMGWNGYSGSKRQFNHFIMKYVCGDEKNIVREVIEYIIKPCCMFIKNYVSIEKIKAKGHTFESYFDEKFQEEKRKFIFSLGVTDPYCFFEIYKELKKVSQKETIFSKYKLLEPKCIFLAIQFI